MPTPKIPRTLKDTFPPEYRGGYKPPKKRAQEMNAKGTLIYRLTPAEVAHFWRCVDYWQPRLSLMDWRITQKVVDAAAHMAAVEKWDKPQRQCRINLCTDWGQSEPTLLEIERAAVHELLHVVLQPLTSLVEDSGRAYGEDQKFAEHSVINRLEHLLVPTATVFN